QGELENVVGLVDKQDKTFCTGTLIQPTVVLTAAHCINRPRLQEFHVSAGSELHKISRVYSYAKSHSDFYMRNDQNEKLMHDLALVILRKPITEIKHAQI